MPPTRERVFHIEAVILRHSDWGEADRLLVMFSRERGKLRGIAKGARRLRSRKAGHIEPFTRAQLQLARGRDLPIVTQAETVDAYLPLREDLLRTGYAAYVVEVLDRFLYEDEEQALLYRLLVETLERLSSGPDPLLALRYFEIHLLDLVGFRPELQNCVSCGAEIQAEDQYFSALKGGVLCPRCGPGQPDAQAVSVDALRFMRHLQRSNWEEAARARIPAPVQAEIEALLQHYLTFLLERGLNTPAFVRLARKSQDGPGEG